MALALGAAERVGSRRALVRVLADCAFRRGDLGRAAEVQTPVLRDPPSVVPLAATAALLIASPRRGAAALAAVPYATVASPQRDRLGRGDRGGS